MFDFMDWLKKDVLESLIKKFLKEGLSFNIDTDFQVKTPENKSLMTVHVKGEITVKKQRKQTF